MINYCDGGGFGSSGDDMMVINVFKVVLRKRLVMVVFRTVVNIWW